jgi:predicted nucleotidyltransferase
MKVFSSLIHRLKKDRFCFGDAIERKQIEDILNLHATDQPYRVLVFGSRATGKARKYSDIDIDLALIGTSTISPKVTALLAEAFDDSSLPYAVDILLTGRTPAIGYLSKYDSMVRSYCSYEQQISAYF